MLKKEEITYIEQMTKQIVNALKENSIILLKLKQENQEAKEIIAELEHKIKTLQNQKPRNHG